MCCLVGASGAVAQTQTAPSSSPTYDALVTGTALGVTNGYSSRYATGVSANMYTPQVDVHAQATAQFQEESGGFFVGGFSTPITTYIKPTILAGTSTYNQGILPELYLYGNVAITTPPSVGLVATPAFTYRTFRNTVKEAQPRLEFNYYLPPYASGSYILLQAAGAVSFVSPGYHTGYELSGSISYIMPKIGSLGLEGFGGIMAYDNILCTNACGVTNGFVGVRPKVSIFAGERVELIARGEIVRTDFYNVYGGTLGVKVSF